MSRSSCFHLQLSAGEGDQTAGNNEDQRNEDELLLAGQLLIQLDDILLYCSYLLECRCLLVQDEFLCQYGLETAGVGVRADAGGGVVGVVSYV